MNDLRLAIRRLLKTAVFGAVAVLSLAAGIGANTAISMSYELSPVDPATYGVAGGALMMIALLASASPAWRASRVDPVTARKAD